MKEERQIQIQFRLADVEEVQFATLTDVWPEGEMQVTNQLQFGAETDKRLVRCSVHFEYKKNDITQLLLTVQAVFAFARESWSTMYQLEGDEWVLPAGLLQHIADITIGAARGILAVRSADKGLPRVILPLVAVSQVVKNNIRFPRKQ
ncbi:MAG: hypothetical protein LUC86_05040 [Prevotellaceae bacterium]|nr:hypothetical protein [Prevotellaceae bacterium]MCD8304174.1 hypothetical protein [Prevotellaceae bacterium]